MGLNKLALANELAFGAFYYHMISLEPVQNLLFYLKEKNAILGMGVLPDNDEQKLLGQLRHLCLRIHDVVIIEMMAGLGQSFSFFPRS